MYLANELFLRLDTIAVEWRGAFLHACDIHQWLSKCLQQSSHTSPFLLYIGAVV